MHHGFQITLMRMKLSFSPNPSYLHLSIIVLTAYLIPKKGKRKCHMTISVSWNETNLEAIYNRNHHLLFPPEHGDMIWLCVCHISWYKCFNIAHLTFYVTLKYTEASKWKWPCSSILPWDKSDAIPSAMIFSTMVVHPFALEQIWFDKAGTLASCGSLYIYMQWCGSGSGNLHYTDPFQICPSPTCGKVDKVMELSLDLEFSALGLDSDIIYFHWISYSDNGCIYYNRLTCEVKSIKHQ